MSFSVLETVFAINKNLPDNGPVAIIHQAVLNR